MLNVEPYETWWAREEARRARQKRKDTLLACVFCVVYFGSMVAAAIVEAS